MRSDEYAARRLRHATEVKRRPLIGIVAKRTLVTRDKKRRVAIIIKHVFVVKKWRGCGVAQCLLEQALTPAHTSSYVVGADQSKRSKNQPLVAAVVRRHAAQQAAAWRLFARGNLKGRPVRDAFDHVVYDADMEEVATPVYLSPRADEAYLEASLPTRHWATKADAVFSSIYNAKGQSIVHSSTGPDGCYTNGAHGYTLTPEELKGRRVFWNELRKHHDSASGGDGLDPEEVLKGCTIVAAYESLPPGWTAETRVEKAARQRRREMRDEWVYW